MKKEFTVQEIMFLLLYALYAVASLIDSSLIEFGTGIKLVRYAEMLGLVILFCKMYVHKKWEIYLTVIFVAVFGVVAHNVNQTQLLLVVGLLVCAKATSFRRIVATSLLSTVFSLCVIVGSCLIGLIPDYTYERWDGLVHSYGFSYYSEIPFILLFAMMEYMYLRKKKLKWIELAILCGASYVVFKMFMLRLAFVLTLLCIVLYIIVVKYPLINLRWKIVGFITKTGFTICAAVSILLAYFYNADSSWMAKIDELLSTRLYNGHQAFERYDLSFLGQWIQMTGNTEMNHMNGKEYFYIDCGYLFSFISYGILFTIVMICLFTFIFDRSRLLDNKMLFVWAVIIMLFSMINNTWIVVRYNPFIFALPMVASPKIRERWKEYRKRKYMVYHTFES